MRNVSGKERGGIKLYWSPRMAFRDLNFNFKLNFNFNFNFKLDWSSRVAFKHLNLAKSSAHRVHCQGESCLMFQMCNIFAQGRWLGSFQDQGFPIFFGFIREDGECSIYFQVRAFEVHWFVTLVGGIVSEQYWLVTHRVFEAFEQHWFVTVKVFGWHLFGTLKIF